MLSRAVVAVVVAILVSWMTWRRSRWSCETFKATTTLRKLYDQYTPGTDDGKGPCGFNGCIAGEPLPPLLKGKVLDVGGLSMDKPEAWPKTGDMAWWNPYPATGAKMVDGGIKTPQAGDLPAVAPPKDRYDLPYRMDPLWQSGPTDTQDLYKQKCKVTSRGKLYYMGPHKLAGHNSAGAYVWVSRGTGQIGSWIGLRLDPQPMRSYAAYKGAYDDTIKELLTKKIELPPWFRRGPFAAPAAPLIRQLCK